ncbi:MAG: M20/M25/M40 family metallo-hydrolase [Conexivisphaerales archaeon]
MNSEQKDEAKRLLLNMLSIQSYSGREGELASYIRDWMESHGYSNVAIDEVGNVSGEFGTGKECIILIGHMDTVPSLLPVKDEGTKLFGRGACDAKGPLAAMLMAPYVSDNPSNFRIKVLACVGEESDGRGIKHAIAKGIKAQYAIFGEPSGHSSIVIGYRGRIQASVEFLTNSFHASSPWMGKSALDEAIEFIQRVRQLDTSNSNNEKFNSSSLCVTKLQSGDTSNVAPSKASLTIDIRIPPGADTKKIINFLEETARTINEESRVSIDDMIYGVEVNQNAELVRALRRAIYKSSGSVAKCIRKTGSGDMNHLLYGTSIQAVTYGPGDSRLSHTKNEYIDLLDYYYSIATLSILPDELSKVI